MKDEQEENMVVNSPNLVYRTKIIRERIGSNNVILHKISWIVKVVNNKSSKYCR